MWEFVFPCFSKSGRRELGEFVSTLAPYDGSAGFYDRVSVPVLRFILYIFAFVFFPIAVLFMLPQFIDRWLRWRVLFNAHTARRERDYTVALELFTKAYNRWPFGKGRAGALSGRARCYQDMGRLDEALVDARWAVEIDPTSASHFEQLGKVLEERGDLERALEAYGQAVDCSAFGNCSAQMSLGTLLDKMGRGEQALTAFGEAAKAARRLRQNTREFLRTHEVENAEGYVIKHQTHELARALTWQAAIHREAGRDEEAFIQFAAALVERPDYAWALWGRGWLREMRGEIDLARADYEGAVKGSEPTDSITFARDALAALEQSSRRSMAAWRRGNILRNAGRYEEALAAYDAALRLDPDSAVALVERAWLHCCTGTYDQAIADASQALELDPSIQGGHAHRGAAHLKLGQLDEAFEDLDEAVHLAPDSAFALRHRGSVLEAQGRAKQARADYEAAAALDPDNPWFKEALQRTE